MEKMDVDVLIIGAGVVGLAVAHRLSQVTPHKSYLVIDRHPKFGYEASSHNSEVIHAGLYYKTDSLKHRACLAGRDLLYQFCQEHHISYQRCGKFVIATEDQVEELEKLFSNGQKNGVSLRRLRLDKEIPGLADREAIESPDSGIIDSHQLMLKLEALSHAAGVMFAYSHFLKKINEEACLLTNGEEELLIVPQVMINTAGLGAAGVLQQVWSESPYQIKPCRGRYFSLKSRFEGRYQKLLYPMPDPRGGLGIHLTFDLSGRCRLGPDVDWALAEENPQDMGLYHFSKEDEKVKVDFWKSGQRLIPDLKLEDLDPDYIGIRCKLFKDGVAHPEYEIVERRGSFYSLHLLGIESPGLTSALALAELVQSKLEIN